MVLKNTYFFWVISCLLVISCKTNTQTPIAIPTETEFNTAQVVVAASRFDKYVPLIEGKEVGFVGNQTSIVKSFAENKDIYTHLVDSLLSLNVKIKKVFSPEHGFRGKADAGEKVLDGVDSSTGIPIISLYGNNKKPKPKQFENIDVILFDLQDVGVRFYTYTSTLHYVMEAATEAEIPVIVLDRPNPNAHYIDGPILETKHQSFIGMHPVPIVSGMTIGEYAQMINGEAWLRNDIQCDLTVISLLNYTHKTSYKLPVKPSPNLPNAKAVNLYPSICLFEGTPISCGRGTDSQFQIFGAPELPSEKYNYAFTPKPNQGAKYPKHQDILCHGMNLNKHVFLSEIELNWILDAYANYPNKETFFTPFFTKLAGTDKLQNQIELGYSTSDIKKTWQPGIEKFKKTRSKYLLYD